MLGFVGSFVKSAVLYGLSSNKGFMYRMMLMKEMRKDNPNLKKVGDIFNKMEEKGYG